MTTQDKKVLTDGLTRLAEDAMSLIAFLNAILPEGEEPAEPAGPEKEYTYEETRAILAEKARLGHRVEVKATLTRHGITQLSDVSDPKTFAALVAEAEEIQIG